MKEDCTDPNKVDTLTLEIQEGDFLRFISGVSGDVIEFLKLETNNGKLIRCGSYQQRSQ